MSIRFQDKVRIEQIRAIEETSGRHYPGELHHNHLGFTTALAERAKSIAREPGMAELLMHAAKTFRTLEWATLLIFALLGATAVSQALQQAGDRLNIFWVLAVLLGFNCLSLLLWCLFSLLHRPSGGIANAVFHHFLPWLAGLRKNRHPEQTAADQAWLKFQFHPHWRLWQLGRLTHGIWISYLMGGFCCLLSLFAFKQFDFIWESTLLADHTFARLASWLFQPMSCMGLNMPEAVIAPTNQALPERQSWALFLLSSVILYGLMPRLLAWMICRIFLRARQNRWELDTATPYYLKLHHQFWPQTSRSAVVDADQHPAPRKSEVPLHEQLRPIPDQALWVALELPSTTAWPPSVGDKRIIGHIQDPQNLEQALGQLKHNNAPAAIMINGDKPADRGLIRQLRSIADSLPRGRAWLVVRTRQGVAQSQFQSWLQAAQTCDISVDQVIPMVVSGVD